ncbi:MAG: carboxypeptidase regulatory-like domain-containing protein [Burkholderiaceae bacterium]
MHAKTARSVMAKIASNTALGAALLIGAATGAPAQAQLPPVQQQGGIEYVSGGIGLDESTAFKAAMPQFPLALTFASRDGDVAAYVADVRVVIRDSQNNDVLNVESNGPYFLARLSPGKYQIFATYNNKTLSQKVAIGASGTKQARFEWL